MKYYIYITPEGVINWIEKMPEEPRAPLTPYLSENENPDYYQGTLLYEELLKHAKADSIPFDMSDDWTEGTLETYLAKPSGKRSYLCGSGEVFAALIKDTIYPIELDADIKLFPVNCGGKNCPGNDGCWGHPQGCGYPDKYVARIVPKKAAQIPIPEPRRHSISPTAIEIWNELDSLRKWKAEMLKVYGKFDDYMNSRADVPLGVSKVDFAIELMKRVPEK